MPALVANPARHGTSPPPVRDPDVSGRASVRRHEGFTHGRTWIVLKKNQGCDDKVADAAPPLWGGSRAAPIYLLANRLEDLENEVAVLNEGYP